MKAFNPAALDSVETNLSQKQHLLPIPTLCWATGSDRAQTFPFAQRAPCRALERAAHGWTLRSCFQYVLNHT